MGAANVLERHSIPIICDDINPAAAFDTEAQLMALFEAIVGHRINHTLSGLISEFACGDGIADMVLYDLRNDWKLGIKLGGISPRWAYALRSLPYRKSFTTSEFISLTLASRNTAINVLRQYTSLGFCERKLHGDSWLKVKQPRPLVSRIIAVEAKLRNWQRALVQATRYRDYASQSWVLLDESSAKPAIENLSQFERLNIGLAALSRTGTVTSYLSPTPLLPKSNLRFWQANAEIALRIKSSRL